MFVLNKYCQIGRVQRNLPNVFLHNGQFRQHVTFQFYMFEGYLFQKVRQGGGGVVRVFGCYNNYGTSSGNFNLN